MPVDKNGHHRPMTTYERVASQQYAEELTRSGKWSRAEIALKVGQRYDFSAYDNLLAYQITDRAKRTVDVASDAMRDPSRRPDPFSIPNSPGDPQDSGRYVHDILITFTSPDGLTTINAREEVSSATPMSLNDMRDYAHSTMDSFVPRRRQSPRSGGGIDDTWSVTVIFLDIARVR